MNMQQMVQAMQKTQREFNKEYAKLEAKEFKANANGVVEVVVMGDLSLKAVNILDDSILSKENKEELSDMICLAYKKCQEEIQKESDAISNKFKQGAKKDFIKKILQVNALFVIVLMTNAIQVKIQENVVAVP